MPQGDSRVEPRDQMLRRRWVSIVLSILIALAVVLHPGQTTPASADLDAAPAVMSSDSDSACNSGEHAKTTHCGTIVACSLYAPLEASAEIFTVRRAHSSPSSEPVHVSWTASPQLQPPQLPSDLIERGAAAPAFIG